MTDDYETDAAFMERFLREHGPASTMQIIRASEAQRGGLGLTPHSRADTIRKRINAKGEEVYCDRVRRAGVRGPKGWEYVYWIGPLHSPVVTREEWYAVMEGAAA